LSLAFISPADQGLDRKPCFFGQKSEIRNTKSETNDKNKNVQMTKTSNFQRARPGATEAGKCQGEKNPVWAQG
jgi:hypothetical protein